MNSSCATSFFAILFLLGGCISVKTESEIKPIHITMDINLKVDRELNKSFAKEDDTLKVKGDFSVIKRLVDEQHAGFTRLAMLEKRAKATEADELVIIEENARRLKRFMEIARETGVTTESVQKRRAAKLREVLPSGAWIQDEDGTWRQK